MMKSISLTTKKQTQSATNDISPLGFLKKELKESHGVSDYKEFLPLLRDLHKSKKVSISTDVIKTWNNFSDISAKDCRVLLGALKN